MDYTLGELPGGGTEIVLATDASDHATRLFGRLFASLAMRRMRRRLTSIQA